MPFLVGELGGRPAGGGLTRAFAFRQWHFGPGKLEVLEPAGAPGGFMHRFLDRRGPGVHHVTFEVPDIDAACAKAESMGFAVVERDDSDPEWSEAFLHPKTSMSIVVQMVQVRRAADLAPEPRIVEPEPGDPDPGALGIELIGLRLRAKTLARARELWCDLLGGKGRVADGELEVRWPGSPMRLVVRRSGGGEEGPVAIEIACLRPALVPVGPHPLSRCGVRNRGHHRARAARRLRRAAGGERRVRIVRRRRELLSRSRRIGPRGPGAVVSSELRAFRGKGEAP